MRPQERKLRKSLGAVLFLAALCAVVFVFRTTIDAVALNIRAKVFPCATPITYSIGTFDDRFDISEQTFLADIAAAETIWETVAGKPLFEYAPDGWLKINLVYDERQASTEKLNKLGIVIDDTKASYDSLKAKYDALQADYSSKKTEYDSAVSKYKQDLAAYNAKVESINARGGATKQEAIELKRERAVLDNELQSVDALQAELNTDVDTLNAMAEVLNRLAKTVNATVTTYNNQPTTGEEFTEGEYKTSLYSSEIDIYQFDDNDKLIRVLAHELGHALGLEHVSDENAIMYYLNEGENETPTAADTDALEAKCGI